jgi:hypothetical protein
MKQPPVPRRTFLAMAPALLAGKAGMALKPDNPVVGGTVLRRAAIQSPGFVSGSTGWSINQDGSAEFNNVTIRNGQVVSGTALYYSGTGLPAANTLVASISAAGGTDSAGNVYLAGFATYGKTGITYYAQQQLAKADSAGTFGAVTTVYTATSQAGPWTSGSQLNLEGSNHAALLADVAHVYGVSGAPLLELHSGSGLLSAAAAMSVNAQGTLNITDAGSLSGAVPLVQADISTGTAGNNNTATLLTKAWPVGANEGTTGTTYRVKCLAVATTGQTTIETLTLGADVSGTKTALATLGTAFNGGALSTTYAIPVELVLTVDAVSAGTPEIYLNAPLGDTSANRLSTNSANLQGFSHTAAWDSTISRTLAVYAQWGGAGGSVQSCQVITSRFYREGP